MATLAEALNEPLHSLFAPSSSFTSLFHAAARISGNSQSAPNEASATAALISEACSRGHSSFVADYALEICADPNLSSTDVRHMPVMQGDVCQAWVVETATNIMNELTGVMSGGNMIANPTLISKLLTKLAGVRTANAAIRSGGLPFDGVPEDQLLQCHQLLSALSWMSNQGTSCGHMPDLQRLRTVTEARSNALQDAALEDHCTLTRIQQALPADSNAVAMYPFGSLLGCLKSVFLSDPYGTEVDAVRTEARARLVLYYFWDSGSQCDWRGLAEALGVERQKAQWWHALFLLEHALGALQLAGTQTNSAGQSAANNAALQLCMCQDIDIMLYASQLLIALGELVHAERLVQQCCHGDLQPHHHCLPIFERIVLTLLDLDDLHGALAQVRRFVGTGPWTEDVNGLLYFLGTWAQEDDDKRRRFLELPLTSKEETHFEAAFPDLHTQLLQQTAQANNFWRAQVERMKSIKSVGTKTAVTPVTTSTDGTIVAVPQSYQPAEFMFDTESLTARNAKMVGTHRPMTALFQPDSALTRKRQRNL